MVYLVNGVYIPGVTTIMWSVNAIANQDASIRVECELIDSTNAACLDYDDDYATASSILGQWSMNITPIPIPPALYLFGSGLLGLVGVTKRKKTAQ